MKRQSDGLLSLRKNLSMAESLSVNLTATKAEKYETLLPQIDALISGETNLIANLANIMACLKSTFHFFWVGAYVVQEHQLILGPFQGPLACTRISKGKGVCGAAWELGKTIIVPNVDDFPGHIACSSDSKSEIVVPVLNTNKEVVMIIDIDSDVLNDFDTTDQVYLEKLAAIIAKYHF